MPLVLTEADVRAVLPMPDLVALMRRALVQFATGGVQQPLRTVLEIGAGKSFFGVMPACLSAPPAVGTKLVTVVHRNHERGLPSHLATIVLLDPETGALLAILDGRYITEARTAAVSAVSVDVLARPEARTLAILGSGVQARSHLVVLDGVRKFETVRVWSPTESHRNAFARDMQPVTQARVLVADTPEAAVKDADVIVLATASRTPVLLSDWVADGAHICAVGACRPDDREMDGALVARARVFVDSRTGAFSEAGDIVIALREGLITDSHIAAELGELLAGRASGRRVERELTVFKSLGMAVEDVAAAHLAYTTALARGFGTRMAL